MLSVLGLYVLLSNGLIGWTTLGDVELKWKYVEQFGQQVEIPSFGPKLRALDGKSFEVSGYYVPAEMGDSGSVILSKMPYASCFFCGQAGIDSVIEVQFESKPRRFDLDEIVKVRGILRLNDSDFDHLIFIIKNAKEVK